MVNENKTKCFAGIYKISVILHGGLMCYGGFGQPTCKYFSKCLGQFKEVIKPRKYNILIKKFGNKEKDNK